MDRAQQSVWRGADASDGQVSSQGVLPACLHGIGDQCHDQGTTPQVLLDVNRDLLG